jgi:hypothetical protein
MSTKLGLNSLVLEGVITKVNIVKGVITSTNYVPSSAAVITAGGFNFPFRVKGHNDWYGGAGGAQTGFVPCITWEKHQIETLNALKDDPSVPATFPAKLMGQLMTNVSITTNSVDVPSSTITDAATAIAAGALCFYIESIDCDFPIPAAS